MDDDIAHAGIFERRGSSWTAEIADSLIEIPGFGNGRCRSVYEVFPMNALPNDVVIEGGLIAGHHRVFGDGKLARLLGQPSIHRGHVLDREGAVVGQYPVFKDQDDERGGGKSLKSFF